MPGCPRTSCRASCRRATGCRGGAGHARSTSPPVRAGGGARELALRERPRGARLARDLGVPLVFTHHPLRRLRPLPRAARRAGSRLTDGPLRRFWRSAADRRPVEATSPRDPGPAAGVNRRPRARHPDRHRRRGIRAIDPIDPRTGLWPSEAIVVASLGRRRRPAAIDVAPRRRARAGDAAPRHRRRSVRGRPAGPCVGARPRRACPADRRASATGGAGRAGRADLFLFTSAPRRRAWCCRGAGGRAAGIAVDGRGARLGSRWG